MPRCPKSWRRPSLQRPPAMPGWRSTRGRSLPIFSTSTRATRRRSTDAWSSAWDRRPSSAGPFGSAPLDVRDGRLECLQERLEVFLEDDDGTALEPVFLAFLALHDVEKEIARTVFLDVEEIRPLCRIGLR